MEPYTYLIPGYIDKEDEYTSTLVEHVIKAAKNINNK